MARTRNEREKRARSGAATVEIFFSSRRGEGGVSPVRLLMRHVIRPPRRRLPLRRAVEIRRTFRRLVARPNEEGIRSHDAKL